MFKAIVGMDCDNNRSAPTMSKDNLQKEDLFVGKNSYRFRAPGRTAVTLPQNYDVTATKKIWLYLRL